MARSEIYNYALEWNLANTTIDLKNASVVWFDKKTLNGCNLNGAPGEIEGYNWHQQIGRLYFNKPGLLSF